MKRKKLPNLFLQKIALFTIFLILLSFHQTAKAQSRAEQAIHILDEKIPQEKVYLLLSQDQFAAGETVLFKGYVFKGYEISDISTTLFVELLDKNKKSLVKTLIPLYDGQGNGNIAIPEKLSEDIYYIRAYTTWMLNFPEKFQFLQPVQIYNPSSEEKLIKNEKTEWTASLHPESGNLIGSIKTKVAVRLHSAGVPPSEWFGYVTESGNPSKKIAEFKNLDSNVALFSFTPENGKKYTVTVQDNKGQKSETELPEVKDSGISLEVENLPDAIKYTVKSRNFGTEAEPRKLQMIGTVNNTLVYKAAITKRNDNDVSSQIPMKDFPNGILQLTLFDQDEKVAANRLVFLKPNQINVVKPNLSQVAKNLQPRGENEYDLSFTQDFSDYAILVNPVDEDSNPDTQNLLSSLYLTGDLSSPVFAPSRYFQKNADTSALDALLISEKWERFSWESVISGKFPTLNFMPENYISYTGVVTSNGKPAQNRMVGIFFDSPVSGNSMTQVVTDENGKFLLENMTFSDNIKVSYFVNSGKDEYLQVFFQPNNQFVAFKGDLPKTGYHLEKRNPNEAVPTKVSRYVASRDIQKKVNERVYNIEEVKLVGKLREKTKKLDEELSTGLFRTSSDKIFDFINEDQMIGGQTNIIQWLQGRVAGLQVKYEADDTGMPTYVPYLRNTKADIYLDEMKMDAGSISTISPSNIAMVKILRNFMGASSTGGEAIAIYTKKGDMGKSKEKEVNPNLNAGSNFSNLRGFQAETEFNNLDYSGSSAQNISGDFRKMFYWNPSFSVPYGETSNFRFYNNDVAKKYRLTIISVSRDSSIPLFYDEITE